MKRIVTLSLFLLLSFIVQSQVIYLKAMLQGSQEVPANASTAGGIAIVTYNQPTRFLQLKGNYQGLAAVISASHVHSPGAPGVNAAVLFNLTNTGGATGTLGGTATLTPAQETDLLAGNMYVNVHNATFPGGEIRGQLTVTTAGQTEYLTARIQSAQEVPPNGSAAVGNAALLLDKTTGMVYLTGSFSGLSANASAAHIHIAAPGINGPVIIGLSVTAATQGTIHVSSAIGTSDMAQMTSGNAYVNIHNTIYPGGEIRGQLIAESQLLYLKATLQGSQEVPANASTAKGTAIVKYQKATRLFELIGDYQNLSAAISASHVHSPAMVGVNASVLFNLANTGGTSGTLTGTATLTPAQEIDLLNGLMYVNVHNANFPGGEIRGQLSSASPNQSYFLTGKPTGTQENPANASTATGNVTVLLDYISKEVFVTANFSGLAANASAAHLHRGAAGVNGPVIVNLSPTLATAGTVTGNAVVSATFADSMVLGLAYLNIHNTTFPGGEIRAQLGNQVLPVNIVYFNGFMQSNKVLLQWESALELNFQQYEIEQQGIQRGSWSTKGVVAALNNSSGSKYNFSDIPLPTNVGYSIYRLKMVDKDGKITYSNSIRINFKTSGATLSIAANPVTNNRLQYVITGLPVNKKAMISIIDYSGRLLIKTTAATLATNYINVYKLPAGMYRLIVMVDDEVLEQSFTK